MTGPISDAVRDAGRLWAIRVADPAFDGWDALTDWLEADDDHLTAYTQAIDEDDWARAALTEPLPPVMAANDDVPEPAPARRAPWIGALAACLVLALGVGAWSWRVAPAAVEDLTTAPGERRVVAMADGTRIEMGGGTHIRYLRGDPRTIRLDHGEALFDVHHDPDHPFSVTSGSARLIDVGTVFDVRRHDGRLDVAVAAGTVLYRGGDNAIRLNASDALTVAEEGAAPQLAHVDAGAVGGWRDNQLSYDNVAMIVVASDLERNLGISVVVDPNVAARVFSGTLSIAGRPEQVMARLAAMTGLAIAHNGMTWRIRLARGAPS
jgi:transmembrane sensor